MLGIRCTHMSRRPSNDAAGLRRSVDEAGQPADDLLGVGDDLVNDVLDGADVVDEALRLAGPPHAVFHAALAEDVLAPAHTARKRGDVGKRCTFALGNQHPVKVYRLTVEYPQMS
ncbi:hypothetical protein AERO9AM_20475 [Aeromicrobium sp. 9AM]|nr:hypothetical protein AERO9AM_20475 [Aeromicrobium sp. 9AM]